MPQPYLGEIKMFAGTFAPVGWQFCDGQMLPISENETLFNLIGTMYGGDGEETFALPDLRGRIPLHLGNNSGINYMQAENGGVEEVTLTTQQMPIHNHPLLAAHAAGDQITPLGNVPATSFAVTPYVNDVVNGNLNAAAIGPAGGNQPHNNLQPYTCVNFIISMFGIFPYQT